MTDLATAAALALAWLLDVRFGEPSNAVHPVAWLRRALGPLGESIAAWPAVAAFVGGAVAWSVLAAAVAGGAWLAQRAVLELRLVPAIVLLALLIKPAFAARMVADEARAVEAALDVSLEAGRARVARLRSRDVSALDADGVREMALETLATRLVDSVVAPLFWFAVAGLPGAAVYRFASTADAIWRGRHGGAGKWAARADDALSWLPARLTALLLGPRKSLVGEAARTPSPKGGRAIGAMALRLGVRLRGPGVHAFNATAPSPGPEDVARALRIATRAGRIAAAAAVAAWVARAAWP